MVIRVLALVVALFALALVPAQAEPLFGKGAGLPDIYLFPRVVDGAYAAEPYPDPDGGANAYRTSTFAATGFDHVRLTIDLGPFLDDPGSARWATFRDPFLALVERFRREKLGVIVTLTAPGLNGQIPEDQLDGLEGPRFKRYTNLVGRVARTLKNRRGRIALEAMNEPQQACEAEGKTDWTAYQERLVARIRTEAPDLLLFVTGGCWSKIEGLDGLSDALLADPKSLVSVHFYEPFLFTHQGSTWTLPIMPLIAGLPFPANPDRLDALLARAAERGAGRPALVEEAQAAIRYYFVETWDATKVRMQFDALERWRRARNIPPERIVLTEFGASKVDGLADDVASRAAWLEAVTRSVEARGWGWTLWVPSRGSYGVDDGQGGYDPRFLDALRLAAP
ncbi:hypothetical protein JOD31_002189 [Methylopila capsulata]|uniref:Glycosyl hydrolase family 5 n=1 Tax=Methylopila capsulata TaxID=61654 RepID=A0A9W6ITE6_9HYPH|nr:cellulase family glycosylhydrolase [Methylopila capsulata]MBM7851964.1 hypothetical protein [Methylopila capsulata]GLK55029.1 glycosyl hydrolase family 5 [Methylopila capsulata]